MILRYMFIIICTQSYIPLIGADISAVEIRTVRLRLIDDHREAISFQDQVRIVDTAGKELNQFKEKYQILNVVDKTIEDEIQQTEGTIGMFRGMIESGQIRDQSRKKRIELALNSGHIDAALELAEKITDKKEREQEVKRILLRKEEGKALMASLATPRGENPERQRVQKRLSKFDRELRSSKISPRVLAHRSQQQKDPLSASLPDIDVVHSSPPIISSPPIQDDKSVVEQTDWSPYVTQKNSMMFVTGVSSIGLLCYMLRYKEENPAQKLLSFAQGFEVHNTDHQKKARELLLLLDTYIQKQMVYMADEYQAIAFMLFEYIDFVKDTTLTKEILIEIAQNALKIH